MSQTVSLGQGSNQVHRTGNASRPSLVDLFGEAVLRLILLQTTFSDLSRLSQANKTDRNFVEPFLYRRIEWTLDRNYTPPITAFLRTILVRPDVANYVQSLSLLGDNFAYFVPLAEPLPVLPIDGLQSWMVDKAIEACNTPSSDAWKDQFRQGSVDPIVTLILSRLQNLTSLFLGPNFTRYTTILGTYLRSALMEEAHDNTPIFPHLRTASLDVKNNDYRRMHGHQTNDVLPLFFLPGLRSLSLWLDNPETIQWTIDTPYPSRLTSLSVSFIREKPLSLVLQQTRALRSLHWDWHYNSDCIHDTNSPLVEFEAFITALDHVKDTLETLSVTASCVDGVDGLEMPYLEMAGSLEGLRHFGCLKHLKLPWAFLLTFSPKNGVRLVDVLPPHLQRLTITDDLYVHEASVPGTGRTVCQNEWEDTQQMDIITHWLQDCKRTHPKLTELCLQLNITTEDWPLEMRQQLTQLGSNYGLDITANKAGRDY